MIRSDESDRDFISCLSMICAQTHRVCAGDHALVPAKQFYLPHPEHFNPWPAPRLDPATDTNPSILEGLKGNASRLETG
jgi:hypothetical protein